MYWHESEAYRRTLREIEWGSLTGSWDGYRWWLMFLGRVSLAREDDSVQLGRFMVLNG